MTDISMNAETGKKGLTSFDLKLIALILMTLADCLRRSFCLCMAAACIIPITGRR